MISPKLNVKIESEATMDRLALLIDADNAQPAAIERILAEVSKYGEAIVKRIYGDFTSPASSSWKKQLQFLAIKPVQQFAYTTGKNATESTMIIDAMDLLYSGKYNGFCLVTSDSDFTGLATRIREEGLMVYGFGEKKTPEAFRKACNKFIFTEVLSQEAMVQETVLTKSESKPSEPVSTLSTRLHSKLPVEFMLDALSQSSDESGWANLGTFGSYLTKLQSDFDPRSYGYKKLSDLVKNNKELFVTEERGHPDQPTKNIYLRARDTLAHTGK